MSRVSLRPGHGTQKPRWLAEDAVICEPVSAPNSLLTGKLTGNFAESGPAPRFLGLIHGRIQWLPAEFPAQRNREFPKTYQGKFFKEQGISTYAQEFPPTHRWFPDAT